MDTKGFAASVRGGRWVQPQLVGEVAYTEMNAAGGTSATS
jgi:hypothetical protein